MKNMMLFVISGILVACSSPQDPYSYKEEFIIQGTLYVNEGIDSFMVTRTLPLDNNYDSTKAAVPTAVIKILSESGVQTILRPSNKFPGAWEDTTFIISPLTRYFLTIEIPGYEIITAETKTPGSLPIIMANKDSLSFIGDAFNEDSLAIEWAQVSGANYYFISVNYMGPDSAIETSKPFEGYKPVANLRRFRGTWVAVNRARLYGFLHRFIGPHRLQITAMDENLSNYVKTQFQSDRTLNEPISNIQHGIGYFGSGSRQQMDYKLKL